MAKLVGLVNEGVIDTDAIQNLIAKEFGDCEVYSGDLPGIAGELLLAVRGGTSCINQQLLQSFVRDGKRCIISFI